MSVQDVYLLALHEPYQSAQHPVPINATIVHALTLLHPAVPQRVQYVSGSDPNRRLYNPQLMEVKTDDSTRQLAVQYAHTRIGSGYNKNFAFNRRDWKYGEVGTYNCSQLVWAAYMNASGGEIDLDADGGWGVWPKDIRDSSWVTHYS